MDVVERQPMSERRIETGVYDVAAGIRDPSPGSPEVSVVMPCLNEADTLASCIGKAQRAMSEAGLRWEVVVADNGSLDPSAQIAASCGARVVAVPERGYGNALMAGIAAAKASLVVMGDADDSYDFGEIPNFVAKLRDGYDFVQGCRLPSGGGRVLPGAMPMLHRIWGNPMFSRFARWWFGTPVHDINCGLRAFRKEAYARLDQQCTGMEFAVEMIIKASLLKLRIAELPITLHPDGRKSHAAHLRTFRDGWRTLRFFLMYSPRWLFLVPGALLILAGVAGYAIALPGLTVDGVRFDVHTLLFASVAILCGYQAILFAILSKAFAIGEGLLPEDPFFMRLFRLIPLERGLLLGAAAFLAGCGLLAVAVNDWRVAGFGDLNYVRTMRWVIPGATLTALGFQTVLASFFASLLGLRRK